MRFGGTPQYHSHGCITVRCDRSSENSSDIQGRLPQFHRSFRLSHRHKHPRSLASPPSCTAADHDMSAWWLRRDLASVRQIEATFESTRITGSAAVQTNMRPRTASSYRSLDERAMRLDRRVWFVMHRQRQRFVWCPSAPHDFAIKSRPPARAKLIPCRKPKMMSSDSHTVASPEPRRGADPNPVKTRRNLEANNRPESKPTASTSRSSQTRIHCLELDLEPITLARSTLLCLSEIVNAPCLEPFFRRSRCVVQSGVRFERNFCTEQPRREWLARLVSETNDVPQRVTFN